MGPIQLEIVGAGASGCYIARRVVEEMPHAAVHILEKRDHVAGHCYDYYDEAGILTQQYGPHYFRTNSKRQLDWLSRFSNWREGSYVVKSSVNGQLYDFPVNLNTISQLLGRMCDKEDFERYLAEQRVPIAEPANAEEQCLSLVGRELYELFFRGYTRKHWGVDPAQLEPEVTARIPLRFNRDNRYPSETYQMMPVRGYHALFENMVDHPRVRVHTGVDFFLERNTLTYDALVYTGELDGFFEYSDGSLRYRSLRFEKLVFRNTAKVQECVQINYPNDHEYTRTVEIKHVTGQNTPHTNVVYEYPVDQGEPFYPFLDEENKTLAEGYRKRAAALESTGVFFVGRLAEFRYYNINQAFDAAERLLQERLLPYLREVRGGDG